MLLNLQNLSQPMNILIVGATRGIGLGFVKHFLQEDPEAHIYATYRNTSITEALTALQGEYPQQLTLIQWDITQDEDFNHGVTQIHQNSPTLDLVLYCVGILHNQTLSPEKSLKQITREGLLHYFQINSIGGILIAKHVLPLLKHRNRSVLAFISAKVGSIEDNRLGGWYGYRASKAALNMFIKTTAIEYARRSPKTLVLSLHPGTTDTDLSKPFQRNVSPEKLFPVERTVQQLVDVMNQATASGQFFSWDGSILPW